MNQLKLGTILAAISDLRDSGMSMKEIAELPVYIGNDDELNGIHCAWYAQPIDANNKDDEGFVELINEDSCNIELKGKAILIS